MSNKTIDEVLAVMCDDTTFSQATTKEEMDRLAAQIRIGHGDELAVVESGGIEREDFGVDQRFHCFIS